VGKDEKGEIKVSKGMTDVDIKTTYSARRPATEIVLKTGAASKLDDEAWTARSNLTGVKINVDGTEVKVHATAKIDVLSDALGNVHAPGILDIKAPMVKINS
jgi:hypothetical protein